MDIRLEQLDLKSLKILIVLAETKNTYKTAEKLHLSQSAVSRALSRLRITLDDPLFIRNGSRLEPTSFVERFVPRLPEVFNLLADAINADKDFSAADLSGEISLALSPLVDLCWGAQIFKLLSSKAPQVIWQFQNWDSSTSQRIIDGELTLGLHYSNYEWPKGLYQQTIAKDEFVLLARKDHPGVQVSINLKQLRQWPLVSFVMPGWNEYRNKLEGALANHGVEAQVQLRTNNLNTALACVKSSDCLMAGSTALSRIMTGMQQIKPPISLQKPSLDIVACYSQRHRHNPLHQWLSAELKSIIKT